MEQHIVASKTIKAIGLGPYMSECKQAEKEGYKMMGNPEVKGQEYIQIAVKFKELEEYK